LDIEIENNEMPMEKRIKCVCCI